jgi:hypothetical protein
MRVRSLVLLVLFGWVAGGAADRAAGGEMFNLTETHLKLLRQGVVFWAPVEAGSPAIVITPLLFGDHSADEIAADVAKRAGLPLSSPPTAAELRAARALMDDMPQAFAQLLEHGKLAPGTYDYPNPLATYTFVASTLPDEIAELAKEPTVHFTFTAQHAALLRGARWQGLFMNSKRPYGDMTYFELDMVTLLGEHETKTPDGYLVPEQEKRLGRLHIETLPALQLYLLQATLAPGSYPVLAVEPGPGFGR